jgi:hypothetical protein
MKKTTSIHSYNADRGLGFFQKFFYLFLNWVNDQLPYLNVDPRIKIRFFGQENWREEWPKTYPSSSASRKFSDLFWMTLPWKKIQEELGEIHVFDTGCGSGNYGLRLNDSSGGAVTTYTGVDAKAKPNWPELQEKHPNFKLINSTSNDILQLVPAKTNFFITQSAIEHFDEDLVFFQKIKEFIDRTDKPVIQIHLFPAAATLPLYLFHGIRQYTPRTVSKITRLFPDSSEIFLYGLGGKQGKKLHWKYFTWPVLILRKYIKPTFDIEKYDKELRKAVEADADHPSTSPIFWALVIHLHPKKKIW